MSHPTHVDGSDKQRAEEQWNSGNQRPQTQRVETRECHVPRANLNRENEVGPRSSDSDDETQNHQHAVNPKKCVVHLLGHEVVTRGDQVGANTHGQETTGTQQNHRHDDVLNTHHLVVGRKAPVASLPHALAGEKHLVSVVLVASRSPLTRCRQGTDSEQEAHDPPAAHQGGDLIVVELTVGVQ